jgi:hypothetical protein
VSTHGSPSLGRVCTTAPDAARSGGSLNEAKNNSDRRGDYLRYGVHHHPVGCVDGYFLFDGEHMKAQPTTKQLIEMLYERLPELFDRAAAQRTWVGLTDGEVRKVNQEVWGYVSADHARMRRYAQAIEDKLKEKNA